jgi:hypothetical protein
MDAKYLRVSTFYSFLRPYSESTRKNRMRSYTGLMGVKEGMRILDLGGQPMIWDSVPQCLRLTILNLPGMVERTPTHHDVEYVVGDACAAPEYGDSSFDSIFSNSVIEHVGAADKRAAFAAEVRRLGKSYWVQTPAKWFPIEAHCGMPLWWFYPARLRRYFLDRWRKKLPEWTEMVEGTTVLSKSELRRLFPEATIFIETSFGLPKCYIAYFPGR